MRKTLFLFLLGAGGISFGNGAHFGKTLSVLKSSPINKTLLVDTHNYYRAQLGIAPLEWSDELAEFAQSWAEHIAKNCSLVHSDSEYGENIYWTTGVADEAAVVHYWAEEKEYFNHDRPVYEKKNGSKYGHYTQIIWADTERVGAGRATCKNGNQIWVCSYDPPGNYIGESVFVIDK